jgi:hypothetical protein
MLFRSAVPVALAAVLPGCERKDVQVYTAPKDRPFVPHTEAEEKPSRPSEAIWRPALTWTLPAGWRDLGPDQANVGRFSAGPASVAVTALASMEGKESLLVNMWRQVRGLGPLDEAEAAKMLLDVPIAGAMGKMFEVSDGEGEKATRFIVAFVHRSEGSLFFKIQGSEATVSEQKAAFIEFLKTVKFDGATSEAPAPPPPEEVALPGKVPEGWTPVAPGPMQQAKFSVPEKDGAKADVTVSVFPSATGGTVENVKRWRRQLGLADIEDAAVAQLAKPLDGGPEGSVMVDLQNESRAMTGAIVPRGGQWWFYKLMGDSAAVAGAREALVAFAKGTP